MESRRCFVSARFIGLRELHTHTAVLGNEAANVMSGPETMRSAPSRSEFSGAMEPGRGTRFGVDLRAAVCDVCVGGGRG